MTPTLARSWRKPPFVSGPHIVTAADIPALNTVFSNAFTERYRKDGLVGVHVPNLNAAVWRFAIDDAAEGAMMWRGERDEIVAFNMCHQSGAEGWMGPLAVDPAYQGHGLGKRIVTTGIDFLKRQHARVIGLETMPRTMDNIGFYSTLGFIPSHLTLTMTIEAAYAAERRIPQLTRIPDADRVGVLAQCGVLVRELLSGYDFTREILLTDALGLGETLILERGSEIDGFALCHSVPLVEGRSKEELRVLKLVARTEEDFETLLTQIADYARRSGNRRVAVRLQGSYPELFRRMVARHARVCWSDLRMSATDYLEQKPASGVVLSNWEI